MNETNPFNDLVMVDGLIVPLSSIYEDLQELVKKERTAGRDIEFTTEKNKAHLLTKNTMSMFLYTEQIQSLLAK